MAALLIWAVIWAPSGGLGSRLGMARRVQGASVRMDGGGFELARRKFVGALATSVATADSLGSRFFPRKNPGTRTRATTAVIPDVPEYYTGVMQSARGRLTPEGLALRSVPTTCPPILAMTQDVLRLDVIRQLDPGVREALKNNAAFWPSFEKAVAETRATLAASPPLLRLFVSDELDRPTEDAVGKMRSVLTSPPPPLHAPLPPTVGFAFAPPCRSETLILLLLIMRKSLDALEAATKERNTARVSEAVLDLALRLETLSRFTVGRFPYSVPRGGRFESLPRLLGRADATLTFRRVSSLKAGADEGEGAEKGGNSSSSGTVPASFVSVKLILDGYSAPISAGNFADLALRGFYNGLPLYDGLGLQPNKSAVGKNALGCGTVSENVTGFVNPYTGDYRTVPLEYKGAQTSEPVYVEEDEAEQFDEEEGASNKTWGGQRETQSLMMKLKGNESSAQLLLQRRSSGGAPALPFEVDGVLGLFHPTGLPDGASSQFFWLARPERDGKRLNGRYSPFALVVGGFDELLSLRAGDVLESVTIDRRGAQNLKKGPGPAPRYKIRTSSKSTRDYNMDSAEEYLDP
eukprot:CAMPEP_0179855228 /NCGR_PEP_ID=MMETSP0982-20121206/10399_1 /TAXON_ID=483367 /ORGANISM="non described non described, Strain CCMP 2436" /LENGTH=577 /DNA_ID=CAMNT_0021741255 /DNA_START=41 /DNA_END=1774 /DNA_ORIENTATION=-